MSFEQYSHYCYTGEVLRRRHYDKVMLHLYPQHALMFHMDYEGYYAKKEQRSNFAIHYLLGLRFTKDCYQQVTASNTLRWFGRRNVDLMLYTKEHKLVVESTAAATCMVVRLDYDTTDYYETMAASYYHSLHLIFANGDEARRVCTVYGTYRPVATTLLRMTYDSTGSSDDDMGATAATSLSASATGAATPSASTLVATRNVSFDDRADPTVALVRPGSRYSAACR